MLELNQLVGVWLHSVRYGVVATPVASLVGGANRPGLTVNRGLDRWWAERAGRGSRSIASADRPIENRQHYK